MVLHAGGNDLCFVRMGEIISLMKIDVERFSLFSPELILVSCGKGPGMQEWWRDLGGHK